MSSSSPSSSPSEPVGTGEITATSMTAPAAVVSSHVNDDMTLSCGDGSYGFSSPGEPLSPVHGDGCYDELVIIEQVDTPPTSRSSASSNGTSSPPQTSTNNSDVVSTNVVAVNITDQPGQLPSSAVNIIDTPPSNSITSESNGTNSDDGISNDNEDGENKMPKPPAELLLEPPAVSVPVSNPAVIVTASSPNGLFTVRPAPCQTSNNSTLINVANSVDIVVVSAIPSGLVRTDPLPSPPLMPFSEKSGIIPTPTMTRTGSFVYQPYETPSNVSLVADIQQQEDNNYEDPSLGLCINNNGPHSAASNSRVSACPNRISKIRQGIMKILKRRSRSGDRLNNNGNNNGNDMGDEAVITAFDDNPIVTTNQHRLRDQSVDRIASITSKKQQLESFKAIKAVLSASSLHYNNNNNNNNNSNLFATTKSTFLPHNQNKHQIIVDDEVITSEAGQYEELPQSALAIAALKNQQAALNRKNSHNYDVTLNCGNKNDDEPAARRYSSVNSNVNANNNSNSNSNSNGANIAFGSSFKAVGSRLFRRRSSGAIARQKPPCSANSQANNGSKHHHQPTVPESFVVMSPTSPAPTIPLPSPPTTTAGSNKAENSGSGDSGGGNNNGLYDNSNDIDGESPQSPGEDLYDPLISFVEITPVRQYHNRFNGNNSNKNGNHRQQQNQSDVEQHLMVQQSSSSYSDSSTSTADTVHERKSESRELETTAMQNGHSSSSRQQQFNGNGVANSEINNNNNNNSGGYYYTAPNSVNNDGISRVPIGLSKDDSNYDDNDDDDAFHREFSLALSILHSQSQDLEKVNSGNKHLANSSPIERVITTITAPMKPPRNSSTNSIVASSTHQNGTNGQVSECKVSTPPLTGAGGKPPLPPSALANISNKSPTMMSTEPSKPLLISQSLEQTIQACEPGLMSRLRLEAPFINRLASEGVISSDFSQALLQLTDRVATRLALLREITANSLTATSKINDDKLHALCSAFKRELNDGDTAILLTSVYGIFKLINTLSDNFRVSRFNGGRANSDAGIYHHLLFESEKSLLVEVLEGNSNNSEQQQYQHPVASNCQNNGRLLMTAGGGGGDSTVVTANDDDQISVSKQQQLNNKSSKFFAERRRLRQLSQSVVFGCPKFALSVCVVNYQSEFGDPGAIQLAQLAAAFNNIVELSLPNAGIGPSGGAAIANLLLNECCCIKKMNLAANKLYNEGAKAIFHALEVNKSLRTLNLGANSFSGDACNLDLTHAFSANRTLLELDMSYNDIGDGGASALGFGLRASGGLEKLRLRRCGLNNASMAKVLSVLGESKCRLVDLDISVNSLAPNCFSLIVHNLSHSRRTISCQLQSCGVQDLSAMTHDTLRYFRELDISSSPIGDAGVSQVIRALSSGNDTLTVLNLNSCDLTLRSGRDLVSAVRNSYNAVVTLKLCHNFKLLSGSCTLCSSSPTPSSSSVNVYAISCHHNEAIRVVEVDNVLTGNKIKVYCTLPDPNHLVSDTGATSSATYEALSPVKSK